MTSISDLNNVYTELENVLPGRVAVAEAVRLQHANSVTGLSVEPPGAVVWPLSTAEVAAIVAWAAPRRVPLIAFGAGTSLEGHVNAPAGGICIDFSRMNRVLEIRPHDLDCTVEAGVSRERLNQELRATGLFFPVDPGTSSATLGGMTATRASGTTTVRYGSMRENVVSLTAVMANGDVVKTAGRARKSSAGYDLTRLLVGSEGTLGLITEVTVKLYGVPETVLAAVAPFETLAGACRTVTQAMQCGLSLARIELLDPATLAAVNAHAKLGLPECPTLFLEFHGSAESCAKDLQTFEQLAADEGGTGVRSATDDDGRRALWKARHDALWAVKAHWPGREVIVTDVAVPLSHLAEAVSETADDVARSGLIAPIVGHVGDGNFHAIVSFDGSSAAERHAVEAFLDRLVTRALRLQGTATGEHGIGQGKRKYMYAEHGPGVDVMCAIKTALDPNGILNPGKILPVRPT
ncbi:MAG: FAD-binding oxidoreductase [Hyphomicrobium sp.]